MEHFQQLGDELELAWRAVDYDEAQFPALAAEALKKAELPSKVSAWDVIDWSLQQQELPPQRDLPGRFGDPPVTLYSGPRFHVDVYFWFEGTTATHQHAFAGAFQVLLGSSIHSWYTFEKRRAVNTFTQIGDMSLKVCELLEIGDVQEIWAGQQYIHSLFHLDYPSATIVVRTDKSPLYLPQFSYHKPSLAVDPFFEQPTTTKKLQLIRAAYRANIPGADALATRMLAESDLQTTFQLLTQLRMLLRSNGLEQIFKVDAEGSRFERMMEVVREHHGDAADDLAAVFKRYDMLDEMLHRRTLVTDPEQRFFMALLLNVDERLRIFELITKRYPDADPMEKVLDWVYDLSNTRVMGLEGSSTALGIAEFGDVEMLVLEELLQGKTDEQAIEDVSTQRPDVATEAIDESVNKIRSAVIFRPLLT